VEREGKRRGGKDKGGESRRGEAKEVEGKVGRSERTASPLQKS